jgi:hypothetical protein
MQIWRFPAKGFLDNRRFSTAFEANIIAALELDPPSHPGLRSTTTMTVASNHGKLDLAIPPMFS